MIKTIVNGDRQMRISLNQSKSFMKGKSMQMKDKIKFNKDFKKMQDNSFGSWYKVTYIKSCEYYQYHPNDLGDICATIKLRLENINGYGRGTLFFTTQDNKLTVLNWATIIAMIPVEECSEK